MPLISAIYLAQFHPQSGFLGAVIQGGELCSIHRALLGREDATVPAGILRLDLTDQPPLR